MRMRMTHRSARGLFIGHLRSPIDWSIRANDIAENILQTQITGRRFLSVFAFIRVAQCRSAVKFRLDVSEIGAISCERMRHCFEAVTVRFQWSKFVLCSLWFCLHLHRLRPPTIVNVQLREICKPEKSEKKKTIKWRKKRIQIVIFTVDYLTSDTQTHILTLADRPTPTTTQMGSSPRECHHPPTDDVKKYIWFFFHEFKC